MPASPSPVDPHARVPRGERQRAADRLQRREYLGYLAQRMGPMIHALMLVATLAYVLATLASTLVRAAPLPLWLRLAPALPLLSLAVAAGRVRRPAALSTLALVFVLLLEVGINLGAGGTASGHPMVLPGLLLPVASSVIWLGGWDFAIAMALCALGPLPMLLHGASDHVQVFQYIVYMAIAISLSVVLRAFMARTLFAQFRLERQLREQAHTDGLTGLLRRNRFLELARAMLADVQQGPACMLFLDADHFKQLNDDHGHAAGDEVLVALAEVLRARAGPNELVGRIGGEEFALLLPEVELPRAHERAEQLRHAVHAVQRPDGPLTISVGIAAQRHVGETVESLLERADQAMRQAKFEGRDRIVDA